MNTRRISTAALVGASLLLIIGLTACGSEEPAASGSVVLADVSESADATELQNNASNAFVAAVNDLDAPGKATLFAFNTQVGSSPCEPVVATLTWDENSTTVEDNKKELVAAAPSAVSPYFDCVEQNVDAPGTDIFGGIAEAANILASTPGDKTIVLVTDGCNNSYDTDTCSIQVVDQAWRTERLDALPSSMKPDLSGVTLEVVGLGRGADINSAQVQGLKSFFNEYAEVTNAAYAD
ncbi:hypothetical protein ACIGKQ_21165 [Gordonia sp. NPDC062954]|uniref:hypothetical protein n=1 Tax=Gordonia sp. NPDC062954 TaxID=3364003 RepID=UPI0037C7F226